MSEPEPETPEDIVGVRDAYQALGLDHEASNAEIKRAFERRIQTAEGETHKILVKAREVALSDSMPDGTAVYNILRRDPTVLDVTSLRDAGELLGTGSPAWDRRDTLGSYDALAKRRYEYLQNRLEQVRTRNRFDVDSATLQTLDVCYHALRFRDLDKGKRWVLGPEHGDSDDSSAPNGSGDVPLVTGWKYSIGRGNGNEYYISAEKDVTILVTENSSEAAEGYIAILRKDGNEVDSATHARYGNAKRQAKRWILELSDEATD